MSLPSFGELHVLDASYIPECANVMAQAFVNSPSYVYIVRGEEEYRLEALEWIFTRNLNLAVGKNPSVLRGILNLETKEVACCFLWTTSEDSDLGFWEMIKEGLLLIPFKYGFSTMSRLLESMNEFEGEVKTKQEAKKVVLQRMVVRPDFQGQGLGSKALRAILEEKRDTPVKIEFHTQAERNVTFYKRLGWEVVHSSYYFEQDPTYKYYSWHMAQTVPTVESTAN
eukprot:Nitzschia sp. Nitz4//scaffold105_size73764//53422//54099//NITZ4_005681-RA/size73764-processed-gene-0.22-mRNA-1//-1//CDS//3329532462//8920//frame0